MRPSGGVAYLIAQKVKSGEIVMDMLKPLDFHLHTLARNVGETLFLLPLPGHPHFSDRLFFAGDAPASQPVERRCSSFSAW